MFGILCNGYYSPPAIIRCRRQASHKRTFGTPLTILGNTPRTSPRLMFLTDLFCGSSIAGCTVPTHRDRTHTSSPKFQQLPTAPTYRQQADHERQPMPVHKHPAATKRPDLPARSISCCTAVYRKPRLRSAAIFDPSILAHLRLFQEARTLYCYPKSRPKNVQHRTRISFAKQRPSSLHTRAATKSRQWLLLTPQRLGILAYCTPITERKTCCMLVLLLLLIVQLLRRSGNCLDYCARSRR